MRWNVRKQALRSMTMALSRIARSALTSSLHGRHAQPPLLLRRTFFGASAEETALNSKFVMGTAATAALLFGAAKLYDTVFLEGRRLEEEKRRQQRKEAREDAWRERRGEVWEGTKDALGGAAGAAKEATQAVGGAAVGAVEAAGSAAKGAATGAAGAAVGAARGATEAASSAAKGAKDAAGKATQAVGSAAHGAKEAAAKAKGEVFEALKAKAAGGPPSNS